MSEPGRVHSLDAVRGAALLGGVVLHSTASFWPGFRDARWPISDDSSSLTLAALFFVVHVFRMSLFFAISGFFARLLLVRLGVSGFVKNRLRRIALPFVTAMVVVMPLLILPFIWGQRKLGIHGPPDIAPPIPDPQMPPWGHLWFLYLLLVLYALWLGARSMTNLADRRGIAAAGADRAFGALLKFGLAPVVFAIPACALLIDAPWWILWQGIPAPIMGFVPNLPGLVAYGSAFAFGWFLHRQPSSFESLKLRWPVYLTAAVILTAVSLWLVGAHPQLKVQAMDRPARVVYAATYLIAGWCWIFAIIGAAQRFLSSPSAAVRYVADASFFVYIIHLPVVYLLQAWMMQWPLHWSVKYPLIVALTFAIVFAMYHYGVRSTFVGQFLSGRRYPRGSNGRSSHATTS
jgi:peptidoglycan/LPS O-acetylase OafA/YrhL